MFDEYLRMLDHKKVVNYRYTALLSLNINLRKKEFLCK